MITLKHMKTLIVLVVGLLAVGCGKSLTEEEKKVVGSYEAKDAGSCPACNAMLADTCPACGNPLVGEHVQS